MYQSRAQFFFLLSFMMTGSRSSSRGRDCGVVLSECFDEHDDVLSLSLMVESY